MNERSLRQIYKKNKEANKQVARKAFNKHKDMLHRLQFSYIRNDHNRDSNALCDSEEETKPVLKYI